MGKALPMPFQDPIRIPRKAQTWHRQRTQVPPTANLR